MTGNSSGAELDTTMRKGTDLVSSPRTHAEVAS